MATNIRSGATDGALQINGVDAIVFNAGGAERKLESLNCTQATGALTFTLNPTVLSMRSATLTSGVPQAVNVASAVSLVLPSGGTLGAVTTIQARLIKVLLSTGDIAVINLAGGISLDETGLISTTAISAASTANNVFYSTVARTSVAYRVVGFVDAVNTAGAWGNPVLVQGTGGQALAALSSLGYGQNPVNVARTSGTTYYNTTGKPKFINAWLTPAASSAGNITVSGLQVAFYTTNSTTGGATGVMSAIVPPGQPYVITATTGTLFAVIEW